MMYETALVGLVGTGEDTSESQRKLALYDITQKRNICPHIVFKTPILAVRFNHARMIVILETKIHILDATNELAPIKVIDTSPNPAGICALSTMKNTAVLAYPDTGEPGFVCIYDCLNLSRINRFSTNENEKISSLSISRDGELIATASTAGQVVRVFHTNPRGDGQLKNEFRRGNTYAQITSIRFSHDSNFLVVSSTRPTIHIFQIHERIPEEEQGFLSTHMPLVFTRVYNPERAFAYATNPDEGKSIAAISADNQKLFVITEAGKYLTFAIPPNGNSCGAPIKEFTIKQPTAGW